MPTAHKDRLSPVDAAFLAQERQSSHMHVGAIIIFEGPPVSREEFIEGIESRLHLVPRYRQKLAFPRFEMGRPFWVDDPNFNIDYHVRHTALPSPGSLEQLRQLAGRIFSQRLDRSKPLWETWLVQGLEDNRFALISKTHHALVDGISGVDLAGVLFDLTPVPPEIPPPEEEWTAHPEPSQAELIAETVKDVIRTPGELAGKALGALQRPERSLRDVREAAEGIGEVVWAGLNPAPDTPLNVPIGPHRRYTWVDADLDDVKAIKNELGGTVNDVVLATVAGAVGRHLRRRGQPTDGLELKAMIPVSVRSDEQRGRLGNRVAAMMAPLPVWCQEPLARLDIVREELKSLKEGGQAVGAQVLTELSGFTSPTVMDQAARLFSRQRFFNLVVTNVPGPQFPLYLQGRKLLDVFPMVPLAKGQALGFALMSYDGRINFGLVGDYDVMYDLEDVADDLAESLAELAEAAGIELTMRPEPVRAG